MLPQIKKSPGATAPKMPTPSPMLAASLGLPPVSFNFKDELLAAWQGNGSQSHTLDKSAVATALSDFWKTKRPQFNTSPADLERFLSARYPLIFGQANRPAANAAVNFADDDLKRREHLAANEAVMLACGQPIKFAAN